MAKRLSYIEDARCLKVKYSDELAQLYLSSHKHFRKCFRNQLLSAFAAVLYTMYTDSSNSSVTDRSEEAVLVIRSNLFHVNIVLCDFINAPDCLASHRCTPRHGVAGRSHWAVTLTGLVPTVDLREELCAELFVVFTVNVMDVNSTSK